MTLHGLDIYLLLVLFVRKTGAIFSGERGVSAVYYKILNAKRFSFEFEGEDLRVLTYSLSMGPPKNRDNSLKN